MKGHEPVAYQDKKFTLSPNPALSNLKINTEMQGIVYYKIYDVNGRLRKQGSFDKTGSNISVRDLQQGVYSVQLSDASGAMLANKKFMKE